MGSNVRESSSVNVEVRLEVVQRCLANVFRKVGRHGTALVLWAFEVIAEAPSAGNPSYFGADGLRAANRSDVWALARSHIQHIVSLLIHRPWCMSTDYLLSMLSQASYFRSNRRCASEENAYRWWELRCIFRCPFTIVRLTRRTYSYDGTLLSYWLLEDKDKLTCRYHPSSRES